MAKAGRVVCNAWPASCRGDPAGSWAREQRATLTPWSGRLRRGVSGRGFCCAGFGGCGFAGDSAGRAGPSQENLDSPTSLVGFASRSSVRRRSLCRLEAGIHHWLRRLLPLSLWGLSQTGGAGLWRREVGLTVSSRFASAEPSLPFTPWYTAWEKVSGSRTAERTDDWG
jgi:hypothetical protein